MAEVEANALAIDHLALLGDVGSEHVAQGRALSNDAFKSRLAEHLLVEVHILFAAVGDSES